MTIDKTSFQAGYLIAVANIMHLHDEDTIAEDVLEESGIKANAVSRLGLEPYDAAPLRRLFRNLQRRQLIKQGIPR